jgi:glycosyltransferase involved in cell wall biosynthesis
MSISRFLEAHKRKIDRLRTLTQELGIARSVEFLGFIPPYQIPALIKEAHAFVAPFENSGRMPYVAHTKLFEYAEWGRPIIAPNLPIVQEHFCDGALLFEPGSIASLANCIRALQKEDVRQKLQSEISSFSGRYSWDVRAKTYQNILTSARAAQKTSFFSG